MTNLTHRQETELSKTMSYLLRHGLSTEQIHHTNEYVKIDDLIIWLNTQLKFTVTIQHILNVVAKDSKQRYLLNNNNIRANQGHSVQLEISFTPINLSDMYPVVHGTYVQHTQSIKEQGLKKMQRTHVHFASIKNPDNFKMYRHDCNAFCVLKKTYAGQLFQSENNVILSSTDIEPDYFDILAFSNKSVFYGALLFNKDFTQILLQNNSFPHVPWCKGELPLQTALRSISLFVQSHEITFIENTKMINKGDIGFFVGQVDTTTHGTWVTVSDARTTIADVDKTLLDIVLL
jgi:RNA:NAD 2'-phosphotransferase (TPT1/KptA family)